MRTVDEMRAALAWIERYAPGSGPALLRAAFVCSRLRCLFDYAPRTRRAPFGLCPGAGVCKRTGQPRAYTSEDDYNDRRDYW